MSTKSIIAGVEIGATKLQAVVGHDDGQILEIVRETANSSGGAPAILKQIERMISTLAADFAITSLGFGYGGPVDSDAGIVIKSHQVKGWAEQPLVQWGNERFGVPCHLANDTDLAALAEAVVGSGRHCQRVFYTNIGSGIGGGLVQSGKLYQGHLGSMEFGHTWAYSELLNRSDLLENLCSGWAIGRRARSLQTDNPSAYLQIACRGDLEQIDAQMVSRAWLDDDVVASQLMGDVLDTFGRALGNVITLINPDIVVIGGGLSLVGQPLIDGITAAAKRYVFAPFQDNFRITAAELGELSVPVGALLLNRSH